MIYIYIYVCVFIILSILCHNSFIYNDFNKSQIHFNVKWINFFCIIIIIIMSA